MCSCFCNWGEGKIFLRILMGGRQKTVYFGEPGTDDIVLKSGIIMKYIDRGYDDLDLTPCWQGNSTKIARFAI